MMCPDLDLSSFDLDYFLGTLHDSEIDMAILDATTNEIQNLQQKPMDQWENHEVMEFIFNETRRFSDISYNDLQRFQCISGFILKSLSEDHCKVLSNSQYLGEKIFDAKEHYVRCNPVECFIDDKTYFREIRSEDSSTFNTFNMLPVIGEDVDPCVVPHKKSGRPRSKSFSNKNGKRSEKLWEFLLHLLSDNKTCPQLIKWEDFQEGTFKFVQSNKVARLWGNRKKNENMTYEKFSRAMRYYYKSKVLLPVPGKRLVYKFGPHAKGWKNITPIV